MRKVKEITPSEREEIVKDYKTMTAEKVGEKHNLEIDQVRWLAHRAGFKKENSDHKRYNGASITLEDKLAKMVGRKFYYNCFEREISGYEIGDEEVKVISTTKTITLPIKKANAILTNQFLRMTR